MLLSIKKKGLCSQTFLKMATLVNKDDIFKLVNPQKKLELQMLVVFFSELVEHELMKHPNIFKVM